MFLYQQADSIFHRLHPVSKLMLLLVMIIIPFFTQKPLPMLALLLAYSAMLLASRGGKNLRKFLPMLLIFWTFTFLIWVVVPKMRGWEWSFENASALATRVDSFVLAGLFFVTCSRLEEFTYALTRIAVPYRAAFAISLGFRLVPLFYQNLQIIVAAQKSRGVDLETGSLLRRARRYGPVIAVLISFSIRNADLMAMSLEAKGFGFSPHRTSYLQPSLSWRDMIPGLILLTAFLILQA